MTIPPMFEEHSLTCALCGHTEILLSWRNLNNAAARHMSDHRKTDGQRSAYRDGAWQSVTVLFEHDPAADGSRRDPTYQFLKWVRWWYTHVLEKFGGD